MNEIGSNIGIGILSFIWNRIRRILFSIPPSIGVTHVIAGPTHEYLSILNISSETVYNLRIRLVQGQKEPIVADQVRRVTQTHFQPQPVIHILTAPDSGLYLRSGADFLLPLNLFETLDASQGFETWVEYRLTSGEKLTHHWCDLVKAQWSGTNLDDLFRR